MKGFISSLVFAIFASGCEPPQKATVEIVEPTAGAMTSARKFVSCSRPPAFRSPRPPREKGTAHHHLFVDRDLTPQNDTIPPGVTGILHLGQGPSNLPPAPALT